MVTIDAGASIVCATACTSSGVTAISAAGCSRSQVTSSPSASSTVRVAASPAWVAVDSASDPTRYCAVAATSSADRRQRRHPAELVADLDQRGAVTSVATSAAVSRQDAAGACRSELRGLYV